MKKSLSFWQIGGFVFTGIAGTLLHFLYDWTDQSVIFALFSAVNESIWEHMKLLYFPMFIFSLIEYKVWGKEYENFWCVKLAGTVTGLLIIPVLYYTYTGILGANADWFNIAIFFIAAGAAYYTETVLFKKMNVFCKSQASAFAVLCVIGIMFIAFTFVQPKIPLFMDPVTGTYGI